MANPALRSTNATAEIADLDPSANRTRKLLPIAPEKDACLSVGLKRYAVDQGRGESPPVAYGAGANPYWLSTEDFNGDGAQDDAVSDSFSSALTLLLNQGGTCIALKSSAFMKIGQPVIFTVTLCASVPGSGTVAFKDGSKTIGTAPFLNGKAALATTHLSQGTHTIPASYSGDASFNPHNFTPTTVKVT